jgi:hypothetical protein
MSRLVEGDADARRTLSMAESLALGALSLAASPAGDHPSAPQLARQAEQAQTGVPGPAARTISFL